MCLLFGGRRLVLGGRDYNMWLLSLSASYPKRTSLKALHWSAVNWALHRQHFWHPRHTSTQGDAVPGKETGRRIGTWSPGISHSSDRLQISFNIFQHFTQNWVSHRFNMMIQCQEEPSDSSKQQKNRKPVRDLHKTSVNPATPRLSIVPNRLYTHLTQLRLGTRKSHWTRGCRCFAQEPETGHSSATGVDSKPPSLWFPCW
jgi:hypothetical protein